MPTVYTITPTPGDGDAPQSVAGYASTPNTILLHNTNNKSKFLVVDGSAFTLTSQTFDPNTGPNQFQSAGSVGAASGADKAGNWYSNNDGGGAHAMCMYDKTSFLVDVTGTGFPVSGWLGPDYVQVLKDNIGAEHCIVMNNNDGTVGSFSAGTFAFEGYAFCNAGHLNIALSLFQAVYDSTGLLWTLSAHTVSGFNNNSTLMSTDSSFSSPAYYTVPGAVYGQPLTMWYVPADNSFVMVTATGYLIKWDIATHTIINAVNQNSILSNPNYDLMKVIGKNGWNGAGIPLTDSGHMLYDIDPIAMTVNKSYNLRTVLGNPSFSMRAPAAFLPDPSVLIVPATVFTSTPWKIIQVPMGPVTCSLVSTNGTTHGYGVAFDLTSTLVNGDNPTGTVEFFEGATSLGVIALSGVTASIVLPTTLAAGSHVIHAVYSGDINNPPATSNNVTLNVYANRLVVFPSTLSMDAQQGDKAAYDGYIENNGTTGATMAYTVTSDSAWLTVENPTGSVNVGSPDFGKVTMRIVADTSLLAAGVFSGNLTITGNNIDDSSSPKIIPVEIEVSNAPSTSYLYARNTEIFQDGANAYHAFVDVGSITLSEPGQLLVPLWHILGYFDAAGSVPAISVMFNEIDASSGTGFTLLPQFVNEPPYGAAPSTTLKSFRWPTNMNQDGVSQMVHHVQVRVDFGTDTVKNNLLALGLKFDNE